MSVSRNADVVNALEVMAGHDLHDVAALVWSQDPLSLDGGLSGFDELLGGGDGNDHDVLVGGVELGAGGLGGVDADAGGRSDVTLSAGRLGLANQIAVFCGGDANLFGGETFGGIGVVELHRVLVCSGSPGMIASTLKRITRKSSKIKRKM
jgi:hypothetical protein